MSVLYYALAPILTYAEPENDRLQPEAHGNIELHVKVVDVYPSVIRIKLNFSQSFGIYFLLTKVRSEKCPSTIPYLR